jgi:hypothetical protein
MPRAQVSDPGIALQSAMADRVSVPTANAVMNLARSFSEEALRTLVGIMGDRKAPGAVRIKVCEAALHRGVGLPTQPVDITIQRLLEHLTKRSNR